MAGYQIADSAEELLEAAREVTGIEIIDDAALVPLRVMLKALNEEGQLHAAGAAAMRSRYLRMLCNRLRMFRDFAAHPEIAEEKIAGPVFFCGQGRSGSTKMHRLIAGSGDFNYLTYWKVFNPSLLTGDRAESPQPRIDDAVAYVKWFDEMSPATKIGHSFEPFEAEEESYLLEHSLYSPSPIGWAPISSYLSWLMTQDIAEQFRYLRQALQYLQWQGLAEPQKRWVLKCPMYAGMEREILQVFPDAYLIMTHRDPVNIVASSAKLVENFYKPFTSAPVDVPAMLGMSAALAAHCHNRATIPGFRVLDLPFAALVGNIEPVIEKIYDFVELPLSETARRNMLDFEAAHPQHRHGKFHYSLEDYGMTERQVREAFAVYDEFLVQRFGARV